MVCSGSEPNVKVNESPPGELSEPQAESHRPAPSRKARPSNVDCFFMILKITSWLVNYRLRRKIGENRGNGGNATPHAWRGSYAGRFPGSFPATHGGVGQGLGVFLLFASSPMRGGGTGEGIDYEPHPPGQSQGRQPGWKSDFSWVRFPSLKGISVAGNNPDCRCLHHG